MTTLSIQFFSTIDETVALVMRWLRKDPLYTATVEFFPYRVSPVTPCQVEAGLRSEEVERIVFSQSPINFEVSGGLQFTDRNPQALVLEIGREGSAGLMESVLTAMLVTQAWRRIAQDLKKHTHAGMLGVHDETGATAQYRNVRYTSGAEMLALSGTPLRQFPQSRVSLRPLP